MLHHLNMEMRQLISATRQKCNYDPNVLPWNTSHLVSHLQSLKMCLL